MTCELAADFAIGGSNLYDFGCATGTTLLALHAVVDPAVRFVGIDNSEEMLWRTCKAEGRDQARNRAPQ